MDLKQLLTQTKISGKPDPRAALSKDGGEGKDIGTGDLKATSLSEPCPNAVTDDQDSEQGNPTLNDRFLRPWNKLEKGMKMNRILCFVKTETDEKGLSVALSKELKGLLFNACDRGLFNKVSDVIYNEEEGYIESFTCLECNESTNKYKLKTGQTKHRSVSKSRSNIDRLLKKK